MRLNVLMAENVNLKDLWDVTECSFVYRYQRIEGTCCLLLQGKWSVLLPSLKSFSFLLSFPSYVFFLPPPHIFTSLLAYSLRYLIFLFSLTSCILSFSSICPLFPSFPASLLNFRLLSKLSSFSSFHISSLFSCYLFNSSSTFFMFLYFSSFLLCPNNCASSV